MGAVNAPVSVAILPAEAGLRRRSTRSGSAGGGGPPVAGRPDQGPTPARLSIRMIRTKAVSRT